MADEKMKCVKCGHQEFARQLRYVKLTVGWQHTQMCAVSPCMMCTKCGDLTVPMNTHIGDLAPLVPDTTAPGSSPDGDRETTPVEEDLTTPVEEE